MHTTNQDHSVNYRSACGLFLLMTADGVLTVVGGDGQTSSAPYESRLMLKDNGCICGCGDHEYQRGLDFLAKDRKNYGW